MKYKFLVMIVSILLSLLGATPVFAQEPGGDQVVFGDNLTLDPEEKIQGDVVVFGGNVTMPPGSEIDGDLVVFGGNAEINGTVTGDVGLLGGNIELGQTAVVEGDIGLLGGELNRADGAVVKGQVQNLSRWRFGNDGAFSIPPISPTRERAGGEQESERESVPPAPPAPPVSPAPPVRGDRDSFGWAGRVFDFFGYVAGNIVFLLAIGAVSWLVAAFMPEQMKVTGDTLTESAPLSFGLGLLTTALATVIGAVLLITICLAFIPLLGFILLGIAMLFGWIVAGQVIGERLLIAAGQPYPNFVGSTVLGVVVLTLVATMPVIEKIPCLGWLLGVLGGLLGLIVGLTGLGAVILTRFGTRPYPSSPFSFRGGPSPAPAPAAEEDWPVSEPLSRLERSEAELRAKIEAALAEAGAAETVKPGETLAAAPPETEAPAPADAAGGEEEPASEEPASNETPTPPSKPDPAG